MQKFVSRSGYLTGHLGIPLSFTTGTFEARYSEHIYVRRHRTLYNLGKAEPEYSYRDFWELAKIQCYAFRMEDIQNIAHIWPVFYSMSLDTPEQQFKNPNNSSRRKYPSSSLIEATNGEEYLFSRHVEEIFDISWFKLIDEMELFIPANYQVPLSIGRQVEYEEYLSMVKENTELWDIDRRLVELYYGFCNRTHFGGSAIDHKDTWKPEETKEAYLLCDKWNNWASRMTGVHVPTNIHECKFFNEDLNCR